MAIQITSSVVSRVSTVNLERQLLKSLIISRINLQRAVGKHREEFFTDRSRLFIYDCIKRAFDDRRTVLTKDGLEFEVSKRFDASKNSEIVEDIKSEYSAIMKTAVTEDIECIIKSLDDIRLAASAEMLIRKAYGKLESGDYEEAAEMLRRESIDLCPNKPENRIYNLHADSDEWFEEVRKRKEHPELYAGIPTGFKEFDDRTGGLFSAELTVVFGLSGKGKSTFMKALACNIRKQGRVVLHCGNEENCFQMRSKYMSADSGELYRPFKVGTYSDDEYLRLMEYSKKARDVGGIYIYEFPQQTDATWIERAYRSLEVQGVHVDVIVVDYLDLMKPIQKAYSENDEGGKITSDLKQVAINCNCPVVTATQAGIQSEKQEKKARPFLNQSDVFGTKRKVHSANCLIGIVNQTATAMAQDVPEEQRKIHHLVLCVPKNRDGGVFTFRQAMDAERGTFFEDTDDDPYFNEMVRQTNEMIDDTRSPDKMRSEIDMNALQRERSKTLMSKVDILRSSDGVSSSESSSESSSDSAGDDSFGMSSCSSSDPFLVEPEIPVEPDKSYEDASGLIMEEGVSYDVLFGDEDDGISHEALMGHGESHGAPDDRDGVEDAGEDDESQEGSSLLSLLSSAKRKEKK